MRTSGLGVRRGSSTSGVLPIDSTILPKRPPQGRLRSSDIARQSLTSKSIARAGKPELNQLVYPAGGEVDAVRRAALATGHRRQDDDGVAVLHGRAQAVEDPNVLVVEVDVDVAVEVAVLAEELLTGGGVLGGEGAQDLAHVGTRGLDLGLTAGMRLQHLGDANRCHQAGNL